MPDLLDSTSLSLDMTTFGPVPTILSSAWDRHSRDRRRGHTASKVYARRTPSLSKINVGMVLVVVGITGRWHGKTVNTHGNMAIGSESELTSTRHEYIQLLLLIII